MEANTNQTHYVVAGSFAIMDRSFAKDLAVKWAIEGQATVTVEDNRGKVIAAYNRKGVKVA